MSEKTLIYLKLQISRANKMPREFDKKYRSILYNIKYDMPTKYFHTQL